MLSELLLVTDKSISAWLNSICLGKVHKITVYVRELATIMAGGGLKYIENSCVPLLNTQKHFVSPHPLLHGHAIILMHIFEVEYPKTFSQTPVNLQKIVWLPWVL